MLGPMQLVQAQVNDMLAALIAAGGPFDDAALFVGVFQTIDPHGLETTLADLTMPTGAAATRQAIAWGTPYQLTGGSAVVDAAATVFLPVAAESGSVAGIYLADALVAGNLLAYAPESVPVPISAGHPYSCVVRLVVDPTGRWSVSFSWNG
jgi:hypothetical protein